MATARFFKVEWYNARLTPPLARLFPGAARAG